MKRIVLAILLLAAPLLGDVTITNTYTDGQAARITNAMNRVNKATCLYYGQTASCTTTQVRTEFCRRAGSPGVSDCDGATQVIIYANITTFDKREILNLVNTDYARLDAEEAAAAFGAAKAAATLAQKNAACAALGLPAGCLP